MIALLRPALALVALLTALLGLAAPLAVTGLAQLALPGPANGGLVHLDGRLAGARLIGQDFASERYFHPRPSATTAPDPAAPGQTRAHPYNAAASGASNLAPSSAALLATVRNRIAGAAVVPADSATSSASGLDPHVSPANALRQVDRVARARGLEPGRVRHLVQEHAEGHELGLLGEARVNVLRLNIALDALR